MDIDIDFPSDFQPLKLFPNIIRASQINNGTLIQHNVGFYFQTIPADPITGLAAIPYDKAEDFGFFKFDFLHLIILDVFQTKEQIRTLLKKEPNWTLLQIPSVVRKLFQLGKHYNLLTRIKPQSVLELADIIALIRPAKVSLINAYIKAKKTGNLNDFRKILYAPSTNGKIHFKKSHSVAYSLTIVLQLHLIEGGII